MSAVIVCYCTRNTKVLEVALKSAVVFQKMDDGKVDVAIIYYYSKTLIDIQRASNLKEYVITYNNSQYVHKYINVHSKVIQLNISKIILVLYCKQIQ